MARKRSCASGTYCVCGGLVASLGIAMCKIWQFSCLIGKLRFKPKTWEGRGNYCPRKFGRAVCGSGVSVRDVLAT